jgi:hypothetical protein
MCLIEMHWSMMLTRPYHRNLLSHFADEYEFCNEFLRAVTAISSMLCNSEGRPTLFDQICRDIENLVSALRTLVNALFVQTG